MAIPETLGERLRDAMRQRGVRNKAVADAAGVHINTVSKWLNDAQTPDAEALDKVAALLGVSSTWLRYGDAAQQAANQRLELGARLRGARVEAGVNLDSLAEYLGVSRNLVLSWESGSQEPSEVQMERLAEAYAVDAEALRAGTAILDAQRMPVVLQRLRYAHRVRPFGTILRQARLQAGLTQAELASSLQTDQKAVAEWESSAAPPPIDIVEDIAEVLHVPVEHLLYGNHGAGARAGIGVTPGPRTPDRARAFWESAPAKVREYAYRYLYELTLAGVSGADVERARQVVFGQTLDEVQFGEPRQHEVRDLLRMLEVVLNIINATLLRDYRLPVIRLLPDPSGDSFYSHSSQEVRYYE